MLVNSLCFLAHVDFMGACDLILIQAANFASNQDLQINIRTTIRYDVSSLEPSMFYHLTEMFSFVVSLTLSFAPHCSTPTLRMLL